MKKQEWEQDIINRQRNIVFPDTVLNEGRFYRNIFSRDFEFTRGQRIAMVFFGLCIMLGPGCVGLSGSLSSLLHWDSSLGVFELIPFFFTLVFVLLGAAIVFKGVFPPKPTRLSRLQRYRRPRIR